MDFQTGHFADSVQCKIDSHLADFWSSQNLSYFFILQTLGRSKLFLLSLG